ncbi:glycosyltransferase [Agromyces sp. NPDC055520]
MSAHVSDNADGIPTPPAGMVGAPGPLLRLIRDQRIAFLLVGATNTAIGFAFFVGFEVTIGRVWGYLATLAFAHVFSVLCAFVLYRFFVFKVRGHVWRDLGRFEMVYLVSLGVNAALLPLLVEIGGLPVIPAQALIVVVTTLISFFGHRGFSFRRTPAEIADLTARDAAATTSLEGGRHVPLVSIVIPAFNNEDFLAETIESVLAQTHSELEVIIADHSSTDGTRAVMDRYVDHPAVTLLDTEAGGGALRNWNRVSQAARGEYLKLVCGDDLIAPDAVARQLAALESSPGAVLAASARDIVDADGRPVIRNRGLGGLTRPVTGRAAIRATVRSGTNIFGEPGCVLMRRDALEAVGWWDSRWPYLIDEATYAQVLLRGGFVPVPGALASFRVSASQWSVRLVQQQAEQAVNFHDWLRREHPDAVSATDVRRGNAMAHLMANGRRAAYAMLGRRMSKAAASAV